MEFDSKIVHIGVHSDVVTGAISTPIYQTASFQHCAVGKSTGFDYSRSQNPTRKVLEDGIAALEYGASGFAFASGMAAITAVMMLYNAGDHLIVVRECYGGTYRLFDQVFSQFGLKTTYVDATNAAEVERAVTAATKAIFIETPTNPLMNIVDIRAMVQISRKHNLQLIVDNTFSTPCFQRPLELGADIVVHSGTKYLAGHNDLLCGLVVAGAKALADKIKFIQNATGGILSPSDSWLLIRGIKTLALRMERHNENALKVALWLQSHPRVTKVYYPGLPQHPGKSIHDSQASGYGGIVSFTVDDPDLVLQVLEKVKFIQFAESLGGVETLITFPARQTHADIPLTTRKLLGIDDRLLRLSVGIENIADIINDLDQAIAGN